MSTRNGFISATMEPFEAKFNGVEIVAWAKSLHISFSYFTAKEEKNWRGKFIEFHFMTGKEFVFTNLHQVQGSILQFSGYLSWDRIEYLKKHQNLQIVKWSIDNILFMKQFVTFPTVNMMDTLPIICQDKMKLLNCHSKLYSLKIGFLL